jgi:hypothetical protein
VARQTGFEKATELTGIVLLPLCQAVQDPASFDKTSETMLTLNGCGVSPGAATQRSAALSSVSLGWFSTNGDEAEA